MLGDELGRRADEELAVALRGHVEARGDLGDALLTASGVWSGCRSALQAGGRSLMFSAHFASAWRTILSTTSSRDRQSPERPRYGLRGCRSEDPVSLQRLDVGRAHAEPVAETVVRAPGLVHGSAGHAQAVSTGSGQTRADVRSQRLRREVTSRGWLRGRPGGAIAEPQAPQQIPEPRPSPARARWRRIGGWPRSSPCRVSRWRSEEGPPVTILAALLRARSSTRVHKVVPPAAIVHAHRRHRQAVIDADAPPL